MVSHFCISILDGQCRSYRSVSSRTVSEHFDRLQPVDATDYWPSAITGAISSTSEQSEGAIIWRWEDAECIIQFYDQSDLQRTTNSLSNLFYNSLLSFPILGFETPRKIWQPASVISGDQWRDEQLA